MRAPHTIWQGGLPEVFNPKALQAKAQAWLKGNEWSVPASHQVRRAQALGAGVHPAMVAEFWRVARRLEKRRDAKNERRREYHRRSQERYARALARIRATSEGAA